MLNQDLYLSEVKRLQEVRDRPALDRFCSRADISTSGNENDRQLRMKHLRRVQELQPVHVGQSEVLNDEIDAVSVKVLYGFLGGRGRDDVIGWTQVKGKEISRTLVIVNNQNRGSLEMAGHRDCPIYW